MTAGSCYYVVSTTAKYTLFDTCKEMAFLSIDSEKRMKAKGVIDSIGSRLGKSGASCIYQALFILFGSSINGNISLIGGISIFMIGMSIVATRQLGGYKQEQEAVLN
jgi:AAA family ATP:ADP antiporter